MDHQGDDDGAPDSIPTAPEEVSASFRVDVEKFAGSPSRLAVAMIKLGDYRKPDAIVRSIQRMMIGEVRVSGEMLVVMELLRRQKLRSGRLLAEASWTEHPDGKITADVADFSITIYPATRGRWRSDLVHKSGYRAPWPRWEGTVVGAKLAAIEGLLAALDDLDEAWAYHQAA